jgi:hypothetical protein
VSVPRSSPGYSSISSSSYEKVSLPKVMADRPSVSRKQLPLASDASKLPAQVGRLRLDDEPSMKGQDDGSKSATPPPPPPPRRQTADVRPSTSAVSGFGLNRTHTLPPLPATPGAAPMASSQASHVSQLSRQLAGKSGKSPPPVGKKPAHLASSSPLSKTTTGSTISSSARSDDAAPALPARSASNSARQPVAVTQQHNPPQSPLSRAGGGGRSGAHKGPAGMAGRANGIKPPLAGGLGHAAAASSASVDLLDSMTDGGEGMGGWEALQPSLKR